MKTLHPTKNLLQNIAASFLVVGVAAGGAVADTKPETTLRIQTIYAPETVSGKLTAQFVEDVEMMSGGGIDIEMFYSSGLVNTGQTFDAAASGILDCDMTSAIHQVGKNPAFQFVGDIMGGYLTPYQQLSWLYLGDGLEASQALYGKYDMHLVGWSIYGQESLVSSKRIATVEDFKEWKFRSPAGMGARIFEKLGAKPIVMDFTEIFTGLETGIIDGADVSGLANNVGLGLYDLVGYTNFPGFHSMPSDHLACNKSKWNSMPEAHRQILSVSMEALALRTALAFEKENSKAATELRSQGIVLSEWSSEELQKFRDVAQATWSEFAGTPEARTLIDSHLSFLKELGLTTE